MPHPLSLFYSFLPLPSSSQRTFLPAPFLHNLSSNHGHFFFRTRLYSSPLSHRYPSRRRRRSKQSCPCLPPPPFHNPHSSLTRLLASSSPLSHLPFFSFFVHPLPLRCSRLIQTLLHLANPHSLVHCIRRSWRRGTHSYCRTFRIFRYCHIRQGWSCARMGCGDEAIRC